MRPAPGQQPPKAIPNSVEHRRRYFERKAAGLVHKNPVPGLPVPAPVAAAMRPQRPNPARAAASGRPLTLAEQMGLARTQQANTGAVSVTGNALPNPRMARPAYQENEQPRPAVPQGEQRPQPVVSHVMEDDGAVVATPEPNSQPPQPNVPDAPPEPPATPAADVDDPLAD